MKRRGRPPYPELLTPREQEVLALLREGLSNEQIAERLGVTLAGAKYHVSEILGKLGVSTREEAARWQPESRPWWAAALAPIASLRHRFGWAPQLAIATAVVAVAAGGGLLFWGLMRTNGDGREHVVILRTATGAPTVQVTPTSAPAPIPEVPIGQAITLGTGRYGGMDWSTDSRSVVFALDGLPQIAEAPDFTSRELFPQLQLDTLLGQPRWSPDGSRIAFVGSHPGRFGSPTDSSATIWLANSDGSGLRDLLPGTAADLAPTNSKELDHWLDNSSLLFYQDCGTACGQPYLLDVETGRVEQAVRVPGITTGELGVGILGTIYHWSPDRQLIAVDDMGQSQSVLLYDSSSHEITRLVSLQQPQPPWQWFDSWAPDSSAFLYHQSDTSGPGFRPPVTLYMYDVASGGKRLIATPATAGSWSADGKLIAYVSEATANQPCGSAGPETACVAVSEAASGRELYRVPGPGVFWLESAGAGQPPTAFLPDGRLLSTGYEGTELRLASDGQSHALASANGIVEFRVSPDGRYVILSEPGLQGRILLVTIPTSPP